MSIEERASEFMRTTGHPLNARSAYIAGATEQQTLIDQQKIAANTPPADLLKAYSTFEENAAHQSGFLIGCEWKEARIKELEDYIKQLKTIIELNNRLNKIENGL